LVSAFSSLTSLLVNNQNSCLSYVSWSLTAESGFDPRALHVESEMDKAALGDVHLVVRRIFLVCIIPPMVHAHPFIHQQLLIIVETNIMAKQSTFSTYSYTQNGGSLEKMAVSQLTSSFSTLIQLENSNSPQQMH